MDKTASPDFLLRRAINANPNDPFAWHILGVRMHSKQCIEEALNCFQRAEQIKSCFSASNQFYLAMCLKELNRTEEAIQMLESAITLPTRNAVDKKGHRSAQKLLDELRKELK